MTARATGRPLQRNMKSARPASSAILRTYTTSRDAIHVMATKNDQLQSAWRAYEKEHGYIPASAREACVWAVGRGIIQMPEIDPFDQLAEDMSRALREEYGTTRLGAAIVKTMPFE